jgi:hypothetical protein
MDYPRLRYIQASPMEADGNSRIVISDPLHFARVPAVPRLLL